MSVSKIWGDSVRKTFVLKDMAGSVAGYVRADHAGIYCRIWLNAPSSLAVVLTDGTQAEYALDAGTGEQFMSGDGELINGCYVFREESLILISDESMCMAFERHVRRKERKGHMERNTGDSQTKPSETLSRNMIAVCKETRSFPQRRWPPPPCWDEARYCQGSWQEVESQTYSETGC